MNAKWALVKRPTNFPNDLDCFKMIYSEIPDPSMVKDGCVIIKVLYISIDAAQRVWMTGKYTYIEGVKLNDVMSSAAIGQVVFSKSKKLAVGDNVIGLFGWQNYSIEHESNVNKIPYNYQNIEHFLSVMGISGLTAYFGLKKIGNIKMGETVVVSAAAGGVGIYAVQLAKIFGGKVVALTSSEKKKSFLEKELGVETVIDYSPIKNKSKTDDDFVKNLSIALKKQCPNGIDVYFDNVGGEFLDAVLLNINNYARIICCGAISSYNQNLYSNKYTSMLISKRALMQGYVYFDYFKEYNLARNEIAEYIKDKKISVFHDIIEGIDNCPKGLQKMYLKENIGKIIVKVKNNEKKPFAKL